MQIPYILLQIIIAPLIGALACAFLGKKLKKNLGWVAAAAMLYTTILLFLVAVQLWVQGGSVTEIYQWAQ